MTDALANPSSADPATLPNDSFAWALLAGAGAIFGAGLLAAGLVPIRIGSPGPEEKKSDALKLGLVSSVLAVGAGVGAMTVRNTRPHMAGALGLASLGGVIAALRQVQPFLDASAQTAV